VSLSHYFKEKFRQLLEINEMVGGALDDTNPNRELIKEGKITKVSARDGDHMERYLFLVLYLFVTVVIIHLLIFSNKQY